MGATLEDFLNEQLVIIFDDDDDMTYEIYILRLSSISFFFSFDLYKNVNCEKLYIRNICIENAYEFRMWEGGSGLYIMGTHQDARVSKSSRKAIFRGPLKNEH
jgi:hypothetical protein